MNQMTLKNAAGGNKNSVRVTPFSTSSRFRQRCSQLHEQLFTNRILMFMFIFIAVRGWAQNDFTPASGNWNDSANWSAGSVPDSTDDARIGNGSVVTLDQSEPTVGHMSVGWSGVGTLTLSLGGSITVIGTGGNDGILLGADTGSGTINQTGGSITVNNVAFFLGYDVANTANYNMNAGDLTLNSGNLWARFGNVTFAQNGGAVSISDSVTWGEGGAGTVAVYDLTGGTLNVGGGFYVGRANYGEGLDGSSGELDISGGTATLGSLVFGANLDGDEEAVVNLSGDGLLCVLQSNYSLADANNDITDGNIAGSGLQVSTVNIGGLDYTQVQPVPEPASMFLFFVLAAGGLIFKLARKQSLKHDL